MANILILYSTTDGHTVKICNRLQQVVEQQGHQVTVVPVIDAERLDLQSFDTLVIGASIRYGKLRPHHHARTRRPAERQAQRGIASGRRHRDPPGVPAAQIRKPQLTLVAPLSEHAA